MKSVLAVLLLAIAADPVADDKDRLQGKWIIESVNVDGAVPSKPNPEFIFQGSKLIIGGSSLGDEAVFELDADASPRSIDLTLSTGPRHGQVLRGIYELQNGKLKLCLSHPGLPRPIRFGTTHGVALLTLKREP